VRGCGCADRPDTAGSEYSSNPAVNLLRSWINNRMGSTRSTNVSITSRACWVAHSHARKIDPPGGEFDEREYVQAADSTVSTVKKSQATIPLARARKNCRHVFR
jgi:hypothetical protein